MDSLSDDLLLKIISLLPDDVDRKSFRSTCRSFHRVDSLHRSHLRLLRREFLPPLLSKFPRLFSLDLSVCPGIDDSALVSLLLSAQPSWTRRIRHLNLSRCTGLSFTGLEVVVRSLVNLESVDLSYCSGFGDREAAALSCARGLKSLSLDRCSNVSDVGLANIAVCCKMLERLSIKWCFEITDVGIELLSKKCAELKHLDISFLKVTSESLRWISRIEKMEVLEMVGCELVDGIGFNYLVNGCSSLQVLDISRCEILSISTLISVIKRHNGLLQLRASYCLSEIPTTYLDHFKDLKNLKNLIIDGARVSDSNFHVISTYCKFLVELGLARCEGVTDTGIVQLVSGCPDLKILNLTCCGGLTDLGILAIAETCQNLSCLKLECCNVLSEKSFEYLGSNCHLLEELDLTDCPGVDDEGLGHLSKCTELLCLKLGWCTNISDKGLSYIASSCKKAHEIDLYRCTGIGDNGLDALSSGCRKLRKLILSYCDKITDRGLKCLGRLEELSNLECRGLMNITGTGLAVAAAGCQRIMQLDLKHCENIDDYGFCAVAQYSRNLQQVNLTGCLITDKGLCMLMGNLMCLQDAKLVNLIRVSASGLERALRASFLRLKKVKLLASFKRLLSPEIVETMKARGCKIKWE